MVDTMIYTLLLAVMLAPLSDSIEPVPTIVTQDTPIQTTSTPTIVENTQVESTQVTVEIDKAQLEQIEKLGSVVEVITITQDKYPKPDMDILVDTDIIPGELVLLKLDGIIPDEVKQVNVDWTVLELVIDNTSWKFKERKIKPDDKECFFGAGVNKNKFYAIAHVTYTYVDGQAVTTTSNKFTREILVGEPEPLPTPPPEPLPTPPTPTPDVPKEPEFAPGMFGAAKIAWDSRGEMSKRQAEILIECYQKTSEEITKLDLDRVLNRNKQEDVTYFGKILTDHKNRVQEAFSKANVVKPDFWLASDKPISKTMFDLWNTGTLNTLRLYNTYIGEAGLGLKEIKARAK